MPAQSSPTLATMATWLLPSTAASRRTVASDSRGVGCRNRRDLDSADSPAKKRATRSRSPGRSGRSQTVVPSRASLTGRSARGSAVRVGGGMAIGASSVVGPPLLRLRVRLPGRCRRAGAALSWWVACPHGLARRLLVPVTVRFRVLGPVGLHGADGSPLPLAGGRQGALLAALLARAGEVVSADRLVYLLWGEALPDNPAGALHNQVARLRRALRAAGGDGRELVTRAPGYLLAAQPAEVDAGVFDRLVGRAAAAPATEAARLLAEALALWRGPAYAGFA